MREFKLPVGFEHNGEYLKSLPIAKTGGEAEAVYTERPTPTGLYSWFGRIISVSVSSIGADVIAQKFIKNNDDIIPTAVRKIPLNDVGSLLLQIQRECWEPVIKEQQILCKFCAESQTGDIDLRRIPVPENDEKYTEIVIPLGVTYDAVHDGEFMEEFAGLEYNTMVFAVPTLGHAITFEAVNADQTLFWRNIAHATLLRLENRTLLEDGVTEDVDEMPPSYAVKRGKLLFNSDLSTISLKAIRAGLVDKLPSAKVYYEDVCGCPKKRKTPYFADLQSFFST